jgi:hypothetical protein
MTAVTLFAPGGALANNLKCSELLSNEVKFVQTNQWQSYNQYELFDYRDFKKILFLSDGGKGGRALKYFKENDQMVVSSDFNISYGVNILIDNNQLPFRNDTFDLILMNRGLCPCRGHIACGGIDTQYIPMKNFLLSTINVLNKKDSHSLALFTGYYYPDVFKEVVPRLWLKIIREVQPLYPNLQINIIRAKDMENKIHLGFIGIAISTDLKKPISSKLKELNYDLATSTP